VHVKNTYAFCAKFFHFDTRGFLPSVEVACRDSPPLPGWFLSDLDFDGSVAGFLPQRDFLLKGRSSFSSARVRGVFFGHESIFFFKILAILPSALLLTLPICLQLRLRPSEGISHVPSFPGPQKRFFTPKSVGLPPPLTEPLFPVTCCQAPW